MTTLGDTAVCPDAAADPGGERLARWGLTGGLVLVVAAILVPLLTPWRVTQAGDGGLSPLHGYVRAHVGVGTVPVVVLAVLGVRHAERVAHQLSWRGLLLTTYVVSVLWILALALVDGRGEIADVVSSGQEYMGTARTTTDITTMLHHYIEGIPRGDGHGSPVHVAGHPPGALLFFVALVRVGLGGDLASGLAVIAVAATTAVAVLLTLRALGHEHLARRAAPLLALTPAAEFMGVSADAVFGAFVAWGLCTLALAATARGRPGLVGWSVLSGLLLGYCVYLSYGLPLAGVMALGVLLAARLRNGGSARAWAPLPIALLGALVVAATFTIGGFSWWRAYPVLSDRYWDPADIAVTRPQAYWVLGDLASFLLCAGPMVAAGVVVLVGRGRALWRDASARVVVCLAGSTTLVIAVADLSRMSKDEVERIWLPFAPWTTLSILLLPARWRRWGLISGVVTAVVVQHLVSDSW